MKTRISKRISMLPLLLLLLPIAASAMKLTSVSGITLEEKYNPPFAVGVKNETERPVEAIRMEWRYTRIDGVPWAAYAVWHRWGEGPVLPAGAVRTYATSIDPKSVKPGTMHIVIDGVIFSDGSVAGPNDFRIERFMGQLRETRQYVADEIESRLRKPAEATAWLKEMAKRNYASLDTRSKGDGAVWRDLFISEWVDRFTDLIGDKGDVEAARRYIVAVRRAR